MCMCTRNTLHCLISGKWSISVCYTNCRRRLLLYACFGVFFGDIKAVSINSASIAKISFCVHLFCLVIQCVCAHML